MPAPQSFYHKRRKYCSSSRSSVGEGTGCIDKRNKVILTHFFAGEMLVLSLSIQNIGSECIILPMLVSIKN
jgi:hypothetical protein